MAKLQSCAGLVITSSGLCPLGQDKVKGERKYDMEELLQELQREREKNAELLDRISVLEAQIQVNNAQGTSPASVEERSSKKLKTQKTGSITTKVESGLVSWMSIDDTQSLLLDKCKDAETEETDDSNDVDEPYSDNDTDCVDNHYEIDAPSTSQKEEQARLGNSSLRMKPPKVAFCPKEVRGILDTHALALKNAQSHTMKKIIVFASLGIRHGCEDMYELDYNHFTILRKGEPYVSPNNPGEHVLYENPRVKRKVFYRNRLNPALCPVQILEEEKIMRPSDASCPSCLFLCIKYGGSTRNIPQNEYVRQRMGRNKLKSFGPIICQMARLVNIRTGSFFFKALGITLLFMAGFPDEIVQRETKYRNLDLLQKYYRTDEDAAGEELFHTNPSASELASSPAEKPNSKAATKSKGENKLTSSTSKADPLQKPQQEKPKSPTPPTTQFGLVGYYASSEKPPKAVSNSAIIDSQPKNNLSYNNHHALYPMLPPQPAHPVMPLMYWPSPHINAYPACPPYPQPCSYRTLSAFSGGHYISFHPQPYYPPGLGACTNTISVSKSVEDERKRHVLHLDEEAVSDSESSSSSTEPK